MPNIAQRLRGFGRRKPGAAYKLDYTHPLTRGLALYLPLSEGGGAAHDFTSSGNNGPAPGAGVAWVAGQLGGMCLSFSSSGDLVVDPGVGTGFVKTGWTVSCWVFLSGTSLKGAFIEIADDGAGNFGYLMGVGSGNVDTLGNNLLSLFNGVAHHDSGVAMGTGWHHGAMTYDGTNLRFYIDGVKVNTQAVGSPAFSAGKAATWRLGNGGGGVRPFTGQVDVPAVWTRVLADQEVSQLFSEPFDLLQQAPPRRAFFQPTAAVAGQVPWTWVPTLGPVLAQ